MARTISIALIQLLSFVALLLVSTQRFAAESWHERDVSHKELFSAKDGRVIDVASGQGVPDVFVVIKWMTDSTGIPGVAPGGSWCDLEDVTKTDDDGRFSFVGVHGKLDISDEGTRYGLTIWGIESSTHTKSYRVFAYKPGYIRDGDEANIYSAKYGSSTILDAVPDATIKSGSVVIDPIRLKRVNLDPESRWVYAFQIDHTSRCSDRMANFRDAPGLTELRQQIKTGLASLPCEIRGSVIIQPGSGGAFRAMISDRQFEKQFLAELGGDVRQERLPIRAEQLCRATEGLNESP